MNADHIRAMLCNPVYAGVGAPPIVEESLFARSFVRLCREEGAANTLYRSWDELTRALGLAATLPPRQAWADRWAARVHDAASVIDMLAELRRIYGGQPLGEA